MDNTIKAQMTAFMNLMEARLKENANRGDWRVYNFYYLVSCLVSNMGTLVRAYEVKNRDVLLRSAADSANYTMMIADLFGEMAMKKR